MNKTSTDLGKDNIFKLMLKLSIPAIIAQIVNVLYNIIDRMFIGRMPNGDLAMAGVGVAFPIIVLISAFSALVGMGGAPLAAIKMGQEDNDGAENIMGNSFSLLIVIAIILTTTVLLFKRNILIAFGASEAIISYGLDYITIYVLGTVFVQIALGMNPYINTQGFSKIGMMTVTIGAVINIALDYIFIFKFNLGVRGAALATIISQMISAIWVLRFLRGEKTILKIRKKYLRLDRKIVIPILGLGVSPFIMQFTDSLVLICLNTQLSKYGGDIAVSAMTIMSSVMQMTTLPLSGIAQGAQPIISYNFGAKNIKRVKQGFKLCLVSCLIYATSVWLFLRIAPELVVRIFSKDANLIKMTVDNINIYFGTIFMFAIQLACQQTFLALGKSKISLFLALLRKVILLVPLAFILPMFIEDGLFAVLLSEPISDAVSSLTTLTCFMVFYKTSLSKMESKSDVLTSSSLQH